MGCVSDLSMTRAGVVRLVLLSMFALAIAACGAPRAPTSLDAASVPPQPLAGAVLGGTRENWEAAKGRPTKGVIGDKFGDTEVAWTTSAEPRAHHVELLMTQEQPVAQARNLAKNFHPRDATSVRTYTAPAGQTVEVFRSAALAQVLEPELFGEADPGTFIQIAERAQPRTSRVVIAAGDRP